MEMGRWWGEWDGSGSGLGGRGMVWLIDSVRLGAELLDGKGHRLIVWGSNARLLAGLIGMVAFCMYRVRLMVLIARTRCCSRYIAS